MLRNLHIRRVELEAYQARALQRIVKHAYSTIPFYRHSFDALGLKPDDIKTVDDLGRLPIISKSDIRSRPEDFISSDYSIRHLRKLSTSGSSGQPLQVYISRAEDAYRKAKHLRANYTCGHKYSSRWLTVTSPSHFSEVKGLQKKLNFYSPRFVSVFWDIDRQLSAINDFKPEVLDGYSSSLSILANETKQRKTVDVAPKMIFGGAELIDEQSRKGIEEAFDAPFYDQYATIEFERMAWQCPKRGGYHIDADSLIMEVVDSDGEAVGAGKTGEIVCTSLFNYAMPLIRYKVGDFGVLSDEECPCGRTLPLLSRIEGRCDSLLLLPGGRTLSPRAVTVAMSGFRLNGDVEQFRVIQESRDKIRVIIKPKVLPPNRNGLSEELVAHFRRLFQVDEGSVEFAVDFVDEIPLNPSGKLKIVESKLQR
jgi:phenylacetate-CoA ligase